MSKASIQLSDHFTCGRLIRFTLPSITMMIFTAVYGVVDGFFVSNYAGKTPFAAVNLIIPVLLGLGCVGFMFGTGGSALIAKTMGQGGPGTGQRHLLHDRVRLGGHRRGAGGPGLSDPAPGGGADGGGGGASGADPDLWPHQPDRPAVLCAAI